MNEIEAFYNKYNEEKRLLRPYGRVEYLTTMKYIHEEIGGRNNLEIMDLGCATGRYSLPLAEEGHRITAVDLVNYHLGILRQKAERQGITNITVKKGDALNLSKFPENRYDIILCLGPMYHVFSEEDKVRVLQECRRLLKPEGTLFTAYCMNEFGVILYAFREGQLKKSLENGKLDESFHIRNDISDLFSFDRLEDIDRYNEKAGLVRKKIISSDGPANYMRELITAMDEETFEGFMRYHLSSCERPELLGAGNHTLDILRRKEDEE